MGAVLFHDTTLPGHRKAGGTTPTRALVAADNEHVYIQVVPISADATEVSVMLTPEAAREIATALSAAAHYVDRSPQTPKAA
jgi:hypothetical protein